MKERAMIGLVLALALATGCGRTIPAVQAPEAGNPPQNVEVPKEVPKGEGVVILDTDTPATVTLSLGQTTAVAYGSRGGYATAYAETTRPICLRTPCAAILPIGEHKLYFVDPKDGMHGSDDVIRVSEKPGIARHKLGNIGGSPAGYYSSYLVGTLGLTALTFGVLGLAMQHDSGIFSKDAAVPFTVGGGIGLGLGILGMFLFQPVRQPGATTQFTF